MFNLPQRKERPLLSMQSMGGGAAGGLVSGGSPLIEASGGTKTTPGDGYIYHIFTASGTFAVDNAGAGPDAIMNVCVVGAGGGGARDRGGGGGAGGFRIEDIDLSSGGSGNYTISIGNGGPSAPSANQGPPTAPAPQENSVMGLPGGTSAFAPGSSPLYCVAGGGGGGGGGSSGLYPGYPDRTDGRPGEPYPYPTASSPVPITTAYPGSAGGCKLSSNAESAGKAGAGPQFNSYPGRRGSGPAAGGGGGGAGGGGPVSSNNQNGGAGKQLPWALPTWGWGENNNSGKSGAAPTSPDPTRPAGPTGELPWGTGWFCGGGGGGENGDSCPSRGQAYAGGGRGSCPTTPSYEGSPTSGSDGLAAWGATNTGSGGGGSGDSKEAGRGGPGCVMIRYKA